MKGGGSCALRRCLQSSSARGVRTANMNRGIALPSKQIMAGWLAAAGWLQLAGWLGGSWRIHLKRLVRTSESVATCSSGGTAGAAGNSRPVGNRRQLQTGPAARHGHRHDAAQRAQQAHLVAKPEEVQHQDDGGKLDEVQCAAAKALCARGLPLRLCPAHQPRQAAHACRRGPRGEGGGEGRGQAQGSFNAASGCAWVLTGQGCGT